METLGETTLLLLHGWASHPSYMREVKAYFEPFFSEVLAPPWIEYLPIDKYKCASGKGRNNDDVRRCLRSSATQEERFSMAVSAAASSLRGGNRSSDESFAKGKSVPDIASFAHQHSPDFFDQVDTSPTFARRHAKHMPGPANGTSPPKAPSSKNAAEIDSSTFVHVPPSESYRHCISRLKETVGSKPVIILGWSLGSFPAALLAMDKDVHVLGLVLLDGTIAMSNAQRSSAEHLMEKLMPLIRGRDESGARRILQPMMKQYFFSCFTEPSSLHMVRIMQNVLANAAKGEMLRHAVAYCACIEAFSELSELSKIAKHCPFHAVFSGQTQLDVKGAQDRMGAIVHTVEGRSGHYLLLTCPQETNKVLSLVFDSIGRHIETSSFIPGTVILRRPMKGIDVPALEAKFLAAARAVGDCCGHKFSRRPLQVAALLPQHFDPIAVFGPLQIFQLCEKYGKIVDVRFLPCDQDAAVVIADESGCARLSIEAQASVSDDATLSVPHMYDVLLVPSGKSWHSISDKSASAKQIRDLCLESRIIASVGSGALALAAAGILDGKCATMSKADFASHKNLNAHVAWVEQGRWVADGSVITSGGMCAGIDMALEIVSKIWGENIARRVATDAEHKWDPFPSHDPFTMPADEREEESGVA